jgi:hypothetical protein
MGSHDLLSIILAAALTLLWLWGFIDACVRPGWAFANAGSSKPLWIILQIFDVAYVPTLIYVLIIRNRVITAQAAGSGSDPAGAQAPEGGGSAPAWDFGAVATYPPPGGYSYPSAAATGQLIGIRPPVDQGSSTPETVVTPQPVMVVGSSPAVPPVVTAQPVAPAPDPAVPAVVASGLAAAPPMAAPVPVPAPSPQLAAPAQPAPNWHPDPTARHQLRYWDGARWTEHVADMGQQGVDRLG